MNTGTHWIKVWRGPEAGVDVLENRKVCLPLSGMELPFSRSSSDAISVVKDGNYTTWAPFMCVSCSLHAHCWSHHMQNWFYSHVVHVAVRAFLFTTYKTVICSVYTAYHAFLNYFRWLLLLLCVCEISTRAAVLVPFTGRNVICYIERSSSYCAVNTFHLGYKNQRLNAVCSDIYTKHVNALCGQNVAFWNVKTGNARSNR
jgi:hypothetical protein